MVIVSEDPAIAIETIATHRSKAMTGISAAKDGFGELVGSQLYAGSLAGRAASQDC